MHKDYKDIWYQSVDGLRLYARDYDRQKQPAAVNQDLQSSAILCMHGLTRNSADFEDICAVLAEDYRLIVAEQRGRGKSAYDPKPQNYNPLTYVQDMFTLLTKLGIESVILMGTSMGGIMAMLMAASKPEMVRGIVINDIGPEIAQAGLDRIKGYVGRSAPVSNWQQAVEQVMAINGAAFPKFNQQQWLQFTQKLYWQDELGQPYLAYDPAISKSLDEDRAQDQSAAPDLWPAFKQIAVKPMLLIRGALSDILAPECVRKMREMKRDLRCVEIPDVGHAPLLNEALAQTAIKDFLQSLSSPQAAAK